MEVVNSEKTNTSLATLCLFHLFDDLPEFEVIPSPTPLPCCLTLKFISHANIWLYAFL